uniref:DUF4220 domain-containing protein n=1 Tax=Oryza glaberrima TaxID=4538 RepID=I1QNM9_ORYGL
MAKLATVAAGVVLCRLVVAGGAALGASASATLGASSRTPQLHASARLALLAAARRGGGLPFSPVTLASLPLLPSEMELPANGDRPREWLWLIAFDDLEATYRLLYRHRGEVQQRLDRASDLPILLWDAAEELLDGSLLVVGVVAVLHHLLQKSVETEGKVINILTWLEGHVLPLLAECLQCGLASAVATDACRSDGVLGLLGSPLLGKRELHLGRDCSNEGILRPSILVVVDVAVPNCLPHVPHLEPHPHDRSPLDVGCLGEGRPPTVGADFPDDGLKPVVSTVSVRGGRNAPPVTTAISVDPTVAAESTAVMRTPARGSADASKLVWAAAAARAPARYTAGSSEKADDWRCDSACRLREEFTGLCSLRISSQPIVSTDHRSLMLDFLRPMCFVNTKAVIFWSYFLVSSFHAHQNWERQDVLGVFQVSEMEQQVWYYHGYLEMISFCFAYVRSQRNILFLQIRISLLLHGLCDLISMFFDSWYVTDLFVIPYCAGSSFVT